MSTPLSNGSFLDRGFIFEDRGFIFEDRGFLIKKGISVCIFEVCTYYFKVNIDFGFPAGPQLSANLL